MMDRIITAGNDVLFLIGTFLYVAIIVGVAVCILYWGLIATMWLWCYFRDQKPQSFWKKNWRRNK